MEPLAEGEAHVWLANPDEIRDAARLEAWFALLGADERAHQRRLRRESSRHEYLVAHALVRATLSRYASVAPEAWSFASEEHGRPEISGPPQAPPLRFNLSHTHGLVACAVVRELEIGVDVENTARRRRYLKLAERFFGEAELREIRALEPAGQQARFLELWTLKEAFLKARGSGISLPLRACQFQLPEGCPPRVGFDPNLLSDDPASWQLFLHHPTPTHTLALAIRRPDRRDLVIRLFEGMP